MKGMGLGDYSIPSHIIGGSGERGLFWSGYHGGGSGQVLLFLSDSFAFLLCPLPLVMMLLLSVFLSHLSHCCFQ